MNTTRLLELVWENDPQAIREYLNNAPSRIDELDSDGRTGLMEAAVKGHHEVIGILLESGANPNIADNHGWTALHFAAQAYCAESVKLLVENGAEVDLRDSYGNTPLQKAVHNALGRGEVIQILLDAGSNPNSKNNNGKSPRDLAKMIANYDNVQFFPREE